MVLQTDATAVFYCPPGLCLVTEFTNVAGPAASYRRCVDPAKGITIPPGVFNSQTGQTAPSTYVVAVACNQVVPKPTASLFSGTDQCSASFSTYYRLRPPFTLPTWFKNT